MFENHEVKKIAEMLAALAEPTRLQILHRLVEGPQYVGQLSEALGVPMVNMSHHLGVMRQAGLLDNEKDGRRVVYAFRPDVFTPGDGKTTLGTIRMGAYRLTLGVPEGGEAGKKAAQNRRK